MICVARDGADQVVRCRGSSGRGDGRRSGRLGEIEDQVVGLIVGGGDFLEDHVALAFQFVLVEHRAR